MLSLKELRLSGIGRFVEEQTILFDQLGNLVQVDGQNNNTGGSSGAAKSTIFNSLEFLFGLNSVPNTILQSRLTDNHIHVEGKFELDGQPLTISRGKKLKIDLNGEVTTGSAKLSEERLDSILAIPRHLFRPMLHKRQGEKGFFLNFTPKETNDFLTDCLGLGHFKKHLVNLDAKLLELEKSKEGLVIAYESAKSGFTASNDALSALGSPPKKSIDQEVIMRLKAKWEASSAVLQATTESQQKENAEMETQRPISVAFSVDTSKRKTLEEELSKVKDEKNQLLIKNKEFDTAYHASLADCVAQQNKLQSKIEKGNEAKALALKAAGEIKKIRDSLCPQCEQSWINEKAKTEEERLINYVNELKGTMIGGENATVQLEAVIEKMDYIKSNPPLAVPEGYRALSDKEGELFKLIEIETYAENLAAATYNASIKKDQESFNFIRSAMVDRHAIVLSQARGQAEVDRRAFEGAVFELKSYESSRVTFVNNQESLQLQQDGYRVQFEKISKDIEQIKITIEYLEEIKRAVKSYLSCSFDEALDVIGDNATRLVRNIPTMANATVQLMGTKETKDGKVKEEVNALLNLDGDENIDIRSLCGGERSAIDLAVDLSVIELIEHKTNKGINIFILDEPFTGMDTTGVEMALEILKNSSDNKKLIIVDHNAEVKQMVESKLLVVRDGATSKILQN